MKLKLFVCALLTWALTTASSVAIADHRISWSLSLHNNAWDAPRHNSFPRHLDKDRWFLEPDYYYPRYRNSARWHASAWQERAWRRHLRQHRHELHHQRQLLRLERKQGKRHGRPADRHIERKNRH